MQCRQVSPHRSSSRQLSNAERRSTRSKSRKQNPTHNNTYSSFTKCDKIISFTMQQHNNITNCLQWRQSTSMPIVKVISFQSHQVGHQTTSHNYGFGYSTQIFSVQFQQVAQSVYELSNLQIHESLYLIRQYLLGIQTLSIKFNHEFDISKGFFGVNSKGQAKVWFNSHFIQYPNNEKLNNISFYSKKIYHIIDHLFQIVRHCTKSSERNSFEQLGQRLVSQHNITYAEAHTKLRRLCIQLGINVSNCISMVVPNKSITNTINYMKGTEQLNSTLKKDQRARSIKKSHIYNSLNQQVNKSINKSKMKLFDDNMVNLSIKKQTQMEFNDKQYKPWNIINSTNRKIQNSSIKDNQSRSALKLKLKSLVNSTKKQSDSSKVHSFSNIKQPFLGKSVSNNFDNRKRNSELLIKKFSQSQRQQIQIHQFNPLNQIEEDEPLEQSQVREKIQIGDFSSRSNKKIGMSNANTSVTKNQYQSKISFDSSSFLLDTSNVNKKNSTHNSFNLQACKDSIKQFKDRCINRVKLQQMVNESKNIVNSIMIPNNSGILHGIGSSRGYNFGGLIQIQARNPSSQNTQIEGKQTESLEASRDQQLISSERKRDIYGKQLPKIGIQMQFGLDLMMAKFFTKDTKDLKESVWCGEEKRAQHLHIKLEKLGNFGREICQSYIPQ